jgi:hypothetical protein
LLLSGFLAEKHELTATDVEQVGAEIREELGGSAVRLPEPAPMPTIYEESQRLDNVVRPFATSAIAARLDRIEKTMNTVLDLLRAQTGPLPERRGRPGRQVKGG